ncbi:hypothetical protein F8A10_10495 [Paracoccus kondratievae]|uniref:Uncharacterized protein n=1 Tax=Paracoccus kondratievae TaxID=135740 RepID=A0AAD3P318_9RHOB|nr:MULTISPECIES: hypothetical protein [Paracoccus]QFQ87824.1 hypothetical protein F8A10_10495 [Paracoccus kondratievae]GLK66353.1 hypothetical protein GCM10017635_38300 [Paracoccus kondratievae]SMG33169.1 hypothetical protein SAMN02746000_01938 [Paracoccus sp. J56]
MTIAQLLQVTLIVFSLGLSGFCFTLARRLRRLNDLESGLGGAIAVMTSEISRLEKSILLAKSEATAATRALSGEIERAKEERAFWLLQQKFAQADPVRQARLQRRRRREVVVADV